VGDYSGTTLRAGQHSKTG